MLLAKLNEERGVTKRFQEEAASLRAELTDRGEALNTALAGLNQTRQQLARREMECTHFRAEAARAVSQLETLTDFAERQKIRIAMLEEIASGWLAQLGCRR